MNPEMELKLREAARTGDLEMVRTLLREKPASAASEATTYDKVTALHEASENGHQDVISELLAHRADVNAKDKNSQTPLHLASNRDDAELTPLHVASNRDVVELLLASGANVNAENCDGRTPLHIAIAYSKGHNRDIVELLLANGADVSARDSSGRTPLHAAAQRKAADMAAVTEMLLSHGADVRALDADGHTALYYAAKRSDPTLAQLMWAETAKANPRLETGLHAGSEDTDVSVQLLQPIQNHDELGVLSLLTAGASVDDTIIQSAEALLDRRRMEQAKLTEGWPNQFFDGEAYNRMFLFLTEGEREIAAGHDVEAAKGVLALLKSRLLLFGSAPTA